MKSRVERAFFEIQKAVGTLLDLLGDAIAMARLMSQDLKDEGRKRALQVHTSEFYASDNDLSSALSRWTLLGLGLRGEADEFSRLRVPFCEQPLCPGAG